MSNTAIVPLAAEPIIAGTSILQKLLAVMKDCGYIQKDKRNEFHKYSYASEAAIKDRVHAALVDHGVLPQFSLLGLTEREITRIKDGKPQTSEWLTTANVYYKFTCVETGEYVEGTFYGCGVDPSDKGLYKAVTGAIKYILTSQFLIATGDDPENDEGRTLSKAEKKGKQQEYLESKGIKGFYQPPAPKLRQEPPPNIQEWANIDPEVTPQTMEMRHAAEVAEAEQLLKETTPPKSKKEPFTTPVMTVDRLKKMREIKDRLRELTGADTVYYGMLKAKGYEHANKIDKEKDAMAIWKLLQGEINRLTQEAELLALFEHSSEVLGQREFANILGTHGCLTMADAMALGGDPLAVLLTELKAAVDDRQAPIVP